MMKPMGIHLKARYQLSKRRAMMKAAKQHRYQVIVCFKLLAIAVRTMLANQLVYFAAGYIRK
jgi:hypothetical protein